MKWTKEPPSVPGLYACCHVSGRDEFPEIVSVEMERGELWANAHPHQSWNGQLVKDLAGAWWSDEPLPELPIERR